MKRNEHTSARVAKIAAKVLAIDVENPDDVGVTVVGGGKKIWIGWRDIRALAASCLTQTSPIKKTPKRRKAK